jgi:HK97 family phage major capsid protein
MQYRAAKVDAEPKEGERLSGPDPGRFRFAVSSETPYLRNYWEGAANEILQHDKKSIRTGRLDSGQVPNNFNHDPNKQLGVVDKYEIKDGRLVVEGPFSRSAFAQEKRQDYDDKILTSASVGYRVHKMVRTEDEDNPDAPDECRVTDWEPFDASLVTVPADPTVGAGRAESGTENFPVEIETVLRRSATPAPAAPGVPTDRSSSEGKASPAIVVPPAQEKSNMAETAEKTAAELELARRNDIMAVATDSDFRKYVTIDEAQKAIADSTSSDKFRDLVSRKICAANDASKVGTAGSNLFGEMDKSDQKRFSVFRLVRSLTNAARPGSFSASLCDAALEREFSDELKKRLKITTEGPLIPDSMSRALGTQGIGSGAGQIAVTSEAAAVATYTRPEVIEILRNRPRVEQLGARRLGGLTGVIRLPRQSGAGTAQWVGEGAAVTPSDLSMDFISVTPHRISTQTAWTVELLAETAPDIEGLARADQDRVILLALDLAALSGPTGGANPVGLMNLTGLTLLSPSGTAFGDGGKPLTWADILAFESTVAAANADVATSGFMFTPEVRAQLKATPKFASGYALPIWDDGPKDPLGIDTQGPAGYRAAVTNQLAKNGTKAGVTGSILHNAVFGDWGQLIVADWGAREVVVDPYTQAASGAIVVTQRALHDVACRHVAAFVANPYIAIS